MKVSVKEERKRYELNTLISKEKCKELVAAMSIT